MSNQTFLQNPQWLLVSISLGGSHSQTPLFLVCVSVATVARFGVYRVSAPSLTNCAVSKSEETERGFSVSHLTVGADLGSEASPLGSQDPFFCKILSLTINSWMHTPLSEETPAQHPPIAHFC